MRIQFSMKDTFANQVGKDFLPDLIKQTLDKAGVRNVDIPAPKDNNMSHIESSIHIPDNPDAHNIAQTLADILKTEMAKKNPEGLPNLGVFHLRSSNNATFLFIDQVTEDTNHLVPPTNSAAPI